MSSIPDAIQKTIVLRAPREAVWRAIADARAFGEWFGVAFEGPFVAGAHLRGTIRPTTVDAEVAKAQAPYAGRTFEMTVDRIEPERLFSFRWHPFAIDPTVDYSGEPTTLIVFALEDVPGGTRLTVTESGFDRIPLARRASAFTANEGGWAMCLTLVEKYVGR